MDSPQKSERFVPTIRIVGPAGRPFQPMPTAAFAPPVMGVRDACTLSLPVIPGKGPGSGSAKAAFRLLHRRIDALCASGSRAFARDDGREVARAPKRYVNRRRTTSIA